MIIKWSYTYMEIAVTKVNVEIKGTIDGGPVVPLASWQREGSGRRVIGFNVEIRGNQGTYISLQTRTLNKDGSDKKSTKSHSVTRYDDTSWHLPEVQSIVSWVTETVERFLDESKVEEFRPGSVIELT